MGCVKSKTRKAQFLVQSSLSLTQINCLLDAVADIHSNIQDLELYQFDTGYSNGLTVPNLLEEFKECSEKLPAQTYEKKYNDVLLFMYTSGTCGLPKASVMRHIKCFYNALALGKLIGIGPNDINYCVLPLYHAAGTFAAGVALFLGTTVVVRRTFSASRFWDECVHNKATFSQYIGEICRYLLAQPPNDCDKNHSVRMMFGMGLRPQIWNEFKHRFNIPLIVEGYASSEGNVGMANYVGCPGAVGFLPVFFSDNIPVKVLKMDPVTQELSRGANGFCIPCKAGEVGQIVGKIDHSNPIRRFDGYVNIAATAQKIAHDVLKKGDQWFLSGDAVWCDELGYVFFHDRLGDTFRWRGENVSTTEVEGVMSKVIALNSVAVYGVETPGCEGRAGMAAIEDPDDVVDVKFLGKKLPEVLPIYARPIFLRIINSVDTTGTFKLQKAKLRTEGV